VRALGPAADLAVILQSPTDMAGEQNKHVVRRFIEEIFVNCNVDAAG